MVTTRSNARPGSEVDVLNGQVLCAEQGSPAVLTTADMHRERDNLLKELGLNHDVGLRNATKWRLADTFNLVAVYTGGTLLKQSERWMVLLTVSTIVVLVSVGVVKGVQFYLSLFKGAFQPDGAPSLADAQA